MDMVGYLRVDLFVSVLFTAAGTGTDSLVAAIAAGFLLLLVTVLTFSMGVFTAFTDSELLSFAAGCVLWVRVTVSAGRTLATAAVIFAAIGGTTTV